MNMKWLLNRCSRNRDRISLLASGRLPEPERATIELHLQICGRCQRYYKEVAALNQRLEEWGKCLPRIEPSEALGTRWIGAIQAAEPPMRPAQNVTGLWFWTGGALRPHNRFALAGLGTVWLLILFFNVTTPELPETRFECGAEPGKSHGLEQTTKHLFDC
jgi:anti-sigma factor RsiW